MSTDKAGKVRLTSKTRRGFYWARLWISSGLRPKTKGTEKEMDQALAWLEQNMLRPVAKGDAADQQSTNGDTQG